MVTSSPKSLTPVSSREAQTEGQSTNPLTSPRNAQGREKKKKHKTEKLSQPRGGRGERRRQVVWPRRPDPRAGGGTPVGKARGKPVPSERGLGLGSQQGAHVGNRRGVWVRGTQGRSVPPVLMFGEYEIIRKLKNVR